MVLILLPILGKMLVGTWYPETPLQNSSPFWGTTHSMAKHFCFYLLLIWDKIHYWFRKHTTSFAGNPLHGGINAKMVTSGSALLHQEVVFFPEGLVVGYGRRDPFPCRGASIPALQGQGSS